MRHKSKKIAFLGLCAGVALVLAYVEALLPPLYAAVPGIKLGLPNIAIIFILYRFGLREATVVSFVRIVAVTLLFGNPMMTILRKLDFLSIVGVSVAGAVFHNVGQILTAMVLLGTAELGYYLIVLAITGTISGLLVGLCGAMAVKRVFIKNI